VRGETYSTGDAACVSRPCVRALGPLFPQLFCGVGRVQGSAKICAGGASAPAGGPGGVALAGALRQRVLLGAVAMSHALCWAGHCSLALTHLCLSWQGYPAGEMDREPQDAARLRGKDGIVLADKSHGDGVACPPGVPNLHTSAPITGTPSEGNRHPRSDSPAKRPVGGSAVDTTVAPAGLASHLPAVGGPEGAKKRRRSQGNSKSSAAADGKQPKQAASKVARNDSAKDAASSGTKSGGRESPQSSDAVAASGHEKEAAKSYDKYCHFCQHVKINMLACTTVGCTHRYVYALCFCAVPRQSGVFCCRFGGLRAGRNTA
jgi:hypothetical protein